jgi:hypothetical protein
MSDLKLILFHSSSVVETSITSTESATSNPDGYTSMNMLEEAGVIFLE